MKLSLKRANKARILIGFILLTLLTLWTIQSYKEATDFELFHNKELTFGLAMKLMYHSRSFLTPLIIILSIVGFFITKPIGWILTNSIFAYVFAVTCFIAMPTDNVDWYLYLLGIIPIGLIALFNGTKTLDFYKIKKTDLMTYNLVVIVLGMGFAFLWGYFLLNPGNNIVEIIYGK